MHGVVDWHEKSEFAGLTTNVNKYTLSFPDTGFTGREHRS